MGNKARHCKWLRSVDYIIGYRILEANILGKKLACQKEAEFIRLFQSCGENVVNGSRGGDYITIFLEAINRLFELHKMYPIRGMLGKTHWKNAHQI